METDTHIDSVMDNIFAGTDVSKQIKWEDLDPKIAHKIECYGAKIKMELESEWSTDEERFRVWTKKMNSAYGDIYPHRYIQAEYNHWKIHKIKKH